MKIRFAKAVEYFAYTLCLVWALAVLVPTLAVYRSSQSLWLLLLISVASLFPWFLCFLAFRWRWLAGVAVFFSIVSGGIWAARPDMDGLFRRFVVDTTEYSRPMATDVTWPGGFRPYQPSTSMPERLRQSAVVLKEKVYPGWPPYKSSRMSQKDYRLGEVGGELRLFFFNDLLMSMEFVIDPGTPELNKRVLELDARHGKRSNMENTYTWEWVEPELKERQDRWERTYSSD